MRMSRQWNEDEVMYGLMMLEMIISWYCCAVLIIIASYSCSQAKRVTAVPILPLWGKTQGSGCSRQVFKLDSLPRQLFLPVCACVFACVCVLVVLAHSNVCMFTNSQSVAQRQNMSRAFPFVSRFRPPSSRKKNGRMWTLCQKNLIFLKPHFCWQAWTNNVLVDANKNDRLTKLECPEDSFLCSSSLPAPFRVHREMTVPAENIHEGKTLTEDSSLLAC